MLIHATITVSGEQTGLTACAARLRRQLSPHYLKDEVTEHHGDQALCYDLKVQGGIPFPAFAEASRAFPGLQFSVEWVNVEAGERGSATIANGRVTARHADRIKPAAPGEHPVYVSVAEDGSLRLALTLLRTGQTQWSGYAVTANRDALWRIVRGPGPDAVVLHATDGGGEWAIVWSGTLSAADFESGELTPPLAIGDALFHELDPLARNFAGEWLWFLSAPAEEIAIERERYAQRGYAVSDANVRSARLYRMQAETGENGLPLEYSTLSADDRWVADVVLKTWAKSKDEG
jgi:hypothetical protein